MSAIRMNIDDQFQLYVETSDPGGLITGAGDSDGYEEISGVQERVADVAESTFQHALHAIAAVGRQIAKSREAFGKEMPATFEVSFGVKFTTEGNIWIAKASSEAQLSVKVAWSGADRS